MNHFKPGDLIHANKLYQPKSVLEQTAKVLGRCKPSKEIGEYYNLLEVFFDSKNVLTRQQTQVNMTKTPFKINLISRKMLL